MDHRTDILGIGFDCLDSQGAEQEVSRLVASPGAHQVITANAELVMAARREESLRSIFRAAELVVADGVGVIWASRVLGQPLPQRIPGVELARHLLLRAVREGWPVYLYGASPQVMDTFAGQCREKYPGLRLVGQQHGYAQDRRAVAHDIAQSGARLLLVGLGAPAQEYFIAEHAHLWEQLVAIGVGGSFDVLSGLKARAPCWMRRYGLEWLYRLLREPQRYRRQLALPAFALLVLKTGLLRLRR